LVALGVMKDANQRILLRRSMWLTQVKAARGLEWCSQMDRRTGLAELKITASNDSPRKREPDSGRETPLELNRSIVNVLTTDSDQHIAPLESRTAKDRPNISNWHETAGPVQ
jgi:hypothetical protein